MAERRVVPGLALAVLVLHVAFATQYGWFRDELYYVACGRRLAFGYVDHPPVVAFLARLASSLFPGSLVGLRALAALAAAGAVLLAGELARALGGGRVAQIVAALGVALAPYDLVVGHLFTMNAFEPLVWELLALVVARTLRDASARRLLWLGPIVGVGVLNKHSASWAVAALVVGLAASRGRWILLRRETWIAAGIAAAVVAPHVAWQVAHGFPTREFARAALDGKNEPYGIAGLASQLLQLFHPALAPVWLAGLVGLLGGRALRPFRALGIAVVLLVALVLGTQAKAYYLGPAWTWLFAAGGVVTERCAERWPRALKAAGALAVLACLALVPVAVPCLSVPEYRSYAAALGMFGETRTGEKMERAPLPQLYADMHGWPEAAATVRAVVAGLPPAEQADAVVFTNDYGKASAFEHFGSDIPIASGHNAWWLWGPPRPAPGTVVWIGGDEAFLHELFEDVTTAGEIDHPLARADERHMPIRICRHPKVALATAWPRLKHYR